MPTRALQQIAIDQGMQNLWQNGLRRALSGQTTLEETLRVIAPNQL
jgi:type II secretory ATPase GspE/PulE/Tfp pilus assembly ATPase PilB-like protein